MEEPAIERRQVPKIININGYDLNYKDPPIKGNIFRFRCWRIGFKYFVKIDKENLEKILKKEKEKDIQKSITYT